MHHGDGLTSILSGITLSIMANAAGWVDGAGFAGHAGQTLLFGFLGGLGGLLAKWTVRCIAARRIKIKNKNNNNQK